jgi:predicted nucleotidyltransferase
MRLEHRRVEDLKRSLVQIFRTYPELAGSRFFFFGSRVTGRGNERSDVDVGILGPKPVPARVWLDLQDAVDDLPFLYKVDLVDFQRVSPAFREVALQETEEIGEP